MTLFLSEKENEFLNNFLNDERLSYFSCTIFDLKCKELASWSNNKEWNSAYNALYVSNPPVKQHIVKKINSLVWWDKALFDLETSNFIETRNDVCGTKMICTLVPRGVNVFGAISFGSCNGQKHLVDLIQDKKEPLNNIMRFLMKIRGLEYC